MKILSSVEVAPHTGAWIEINAADSEFRPASVAPHTGAWIEIIGLFGDGVAVRVAPHTGAWIEIAAGLPVMIKNRRRSPHGSVD